MPLRIRKQLVQPRAHQLEHLEQEYKRVNRDRALLEPEEVLLIAVADGSGRLRERDGHRLAATAL